LHNQVGNETLQIEKIPNTVKKQYSQNDDQAVKSAANSKLAVPAAINSNEEAALKHEEKLRKEGYIENPGDPYTMIKKVKKADGKEVTYIMPKDPGDNDYFEPSERTSKTANEIIESKRDHDPQQEVSELRVLDDNEQNNSLLLGTFRDSANDVEIKLGKVYNLDNSSTDKVILCFVAPKLNYNFPKYMNATARVDGTGYGVIQINEKLFIRIAWSMESKRALHGQIVELRNGQPSATHNFAATENRQDLKHCN